MGVTAGRVVAPVVSSAMTGPGAVSGRTVQRVEAMTGTVGPLAASGVTVDRVAAGRVVSSGMVVRTEGRRAVSSGMTGLGAVSGRVTVRRAAATVARAARVARHVVSSGTAVPVGAIAVVPVVASAVTVGQVTVGRAVVGRGASSGTAGRATGRGSIGAAMTGVGRVSATVRRVRTARQTTVRAMSGWTSGWAASSLPRIGSGTTGRTVREATR
jgi:hypothetical protein